MINSTSDSLTQKSCAEITPVKKPSLFAFRKPKGGTSKFISCEDFRFSAGACAIEKNNDGCKGNDTCAKNPEEEYSKYLIIKKN